MVKLGQDKNGNYKARKRLPDDLREEYGRLYGVRVEAKFYAPASTRAPEAKRLFGEWLAEVERRIQSIRQMQRGEGIDLDHKQAHALSGEWYSWFVALHEDKPGKPERWSEAFWHLVDAMEEALPADVQSEEMERHLHALDDWATYPEVCAAIRYKKIIAAHGLKSHKAHVFTAAEPKVITGVCIAANGQRVPNKLHLKIKNGFEKLALASSTEAKQKTARPLLGRLEAAGQIDSAFKARAKTLRSSIGKQNQ